MNPGFTQDQDYAMQVLQQGYNVFLTGDAGTGKSFLLREFVAWASQQTPPRRVLCTATTGIAAQNIDGRTIHSAVKWSPKLNLSNDWEIDFESKAEALKRSDILIVDEISMMTPSFLRFLLKCIQRASPIQIIFIGDFFQLPPVKCSLYAFEAPEWKALRLFPIILRSVVRQGSQEFVQLLRQLRHGDVNALYAIQSRSAKHLIEDAICLCAHVDKADCINGEKMDMLSGPYFEFPADINQPIADEDWKETTLSKRLKLKTGARVLIIANNYAEKYCNGSMGVLLSEPRWSTIKRQEVLPVRLDRDGRTVEIPRITANIDTGIAGESCRISQFPIVPAYAITIHKSQGQTFDRVNIIDGCCWDNGQLYVALSRARSLDGLFISSDVEAEHVKASSVVVDFYKHCFPWLYKTPNDPT